MELYKEPKMIYTCVYLGDEMQFIIRYRKLVPIDIGTNLLSIVPTLQRVLGLYQEPFVIGYTDIIGKNEAAFSGVISLLFLFIELIMI